MKEKLVRTIFTGSLEHRAGKQLSQHGVEFTHKVREVRRHSTRGFRGHKHA